MGFVVVVEERLTAVDARDIRLVLDKRARSNAISQRATYLDGRMPGRASACQPPPLAPGVAFPRLP